MRQRSGCKACRERHIKCVKIRDSEECKYCTARKKPCIRGNAFRFRPVKSVKFNAGEDLGSAEQSLEFRKGQTWVDIPRSLHFIAPNTDGDEEELELGAIEEDVAEVEHETPSEEPVYVSKAWQLHQESPFQHTADTNVDLLLADYDQSTYEGVPIPTLDSTSDLPSIHDVLNNQFPPTHIRHNSTNSGQSQLGRTISSSEALTGTSITGWHASPTSNPHSSPHGTKKSPLTSIHNISPFDASPFSPNSSLILRWPATNAYEASLIHHYIVYCTPWIDVCDSRRYFEREVPKRAAHFPVILNGILGLAARHLWLMGRTSEDHSQPYVDQCLQSLIVALEDPLCHWDENFLVAVILLRLHEEMGDADEQCHHFGTARILNSISSFAADGGLRELASWVSLRQHIYVSLTSQQPLNLSLGNYKHSSVFREFDDEAWANRIIFMFATILQAVFEDVHMEANNLSKEKWRELDGDVNEWERTKPWTFTPLHIEDDAGEKFNGTWPKLPCAQGVVAVGLQYYHLCKIILTIYSPNTSLVGLAGVRARKATDAMIRKHIRLTIGYGVSNSHCGNAMFQGSHILSACGAYVVDEKEQEACVEYLKGLQRLIGWRTDKVLKDLREQWTS
ncbi:hypothetical protein CC86DRAFT_454551 [Ophiobolus disseminans]|uniref:Zn(2)-C6 fungal-type domain-containing protein n=1 Tax=Ophiobolus disseminans TaxID=1469910 RepID=A0A6A7A4Q1_9PLEO|nr:hypothetical protein CC86DRAFT_454551 [Ophiobolus disseminans]